MESEILSRTNTDNELKSATAAGDSTKTWNKIYIREQLRNLNDFARQYPEKALGYAEKWKSFAKEHPEISDLNNSEWETWCDKHPGAFDSMSDFRKIARAVEHVSKRKEIEKIRPSVEDSYKKIAEIKAKLGIPETSSVDFSTPLFKQKEKLKSLQLEDMASEIKFVIPAEFQSATRDFLQKKQQDLVSLPYVSGERAREILEHSGKDRGVMMIETRAIIGSVSPAFENWSGEYQNRRGLVVELAQEIVKGTAESVDHVFHLKDPESGVKVKKISGPDGDLFFVVDGTHRTAAAKLVELPELPAQVEDLSDLSEVRTTNSALSSHWERQINQGFIRGKIEEVIISGQKNFSLKIETQILPWAILPQRNFLIMTKKYLELYPNSLNNLKSLTTREIIPKEALLDEIAMNFYLANRWNEYKPKKK